MLLGSKLLSAGEVVYDNCGNPDSLLYLELGTVGVRVESLGVPADLQHG